MTGQLIEGKTGDGTAARLTAYSSFEPYELADYRHALATALPGVAIEIKRMPTAILTDRMLFEIDAPQADLILGWADTAAQTDGLQGLCLGSNSSCDGYVRPTGFSTAFIADPVVLAACGARPVLTWSDLAQETLKGRILFPDPGISGAGFLAMSTVLQFYGDAAGWDLLEAICMNVAAFPPSAWAPAAQTGSGEIAVGVTVRIAAGKRQSELPHLVVVEPDDVIGTEAEVYGVLKGTQYPDASRKVIEWITSDTAEALFRKYNKTILSTPIQSHFMINPTKANADRDVNIARFNALMLEAKEHAR